MKPSKSWVVRKLKRNDVVDKTIEPAISFIKNIKPNDKVVLVHGHDCDAICSSAIFCRLLKNLKNKPLFVSAELNFSIGSKTIKSVKSLRPNYIIISDIPRIPIDILHELKRGITVLIVDHHIPRGYVGVSYCNPRIYDLGLYLPASYLSYRIYEKFSDVKKIAWIAGVGTLADMGMKNCDDLFEKIKSSSHELIGNIKNDDKDLFDKTILGKLVKIVDSARIVDGPEGAKFALNLLANSNNFNEVMNNNSLIKYYESSEKEFQRLVEGFQKNKKIIGKIIIYEIKTKFDLKSSIATYLQRFCNDEVLVVYQLVDGTLDISFRKGEKSSVDLNKLAGDLTMAIPNSTGGGHPNAAGARVPSKYMKIFLANLKKSSRM